MTEKMLIIVESIIGDDIKNPIIETIIPTMKKIKTNNKKTENKRGLVKSQLSLIECFPFFPVMARAGTAKENLTYT